MKLIRVRARAVSRKRYRPVEGDYAQVKEVRMDDREIEPEGEEMVPIGETMSRWRLFIREVGRSFR